MPLPFAAGAFGAVRNVRRGGSMSLGSLVETLIGSEPFERLLVSRDRPLLAQAETGDAFVVAGLAAALELPVLAVAPGPHEAEALAADVEAFLPGGSVLLPAWEAFPYELLSPTPEIAARRAAAVRRLREASGPLVVVAPAVAAAQGIAPSTGTAAPLDVATGDEAAPDTLADRLVVLGYERADVVQRRGEFAVRGGVLDVFPADGRRPVRLEFWGDEIESIRVFVPSTQLSSERVDRTTIDAARELVLDDDLRARARDAAGAASDERIADLLARIGEGALPDGMESAAAFLWDEMPTPAELLPDGSWVVVTEARRTLGRLRQTHDDAEALASALSWPGSHVVRDPEGALGRGRQLHLSAFTEGTDLSLRGWGAAVGDPGALAGQARDLVGLGYRVVVAAHGHGSLERAREVLGDLDVETVEAPLVGG